jgi:replicative DNA helicase
MKVDSQTDSLLVKGLPCATDAERFVLGSLLLGYSTGAVTATLRVNDFATEKHRLIFAAIVGLEAAGSSVDRMTMVTELQRCGQLESVDVPI